MKIKPYQYKVTVIIMIVIVTSSNLTAQEFIARKERKLFTSTDITIKGFQGRVAYDFYTAKGNCIGFSLAQL
jgi:hypothetical protein